MDKYILGKCNVCGGDCDVKEYYHPKCAYDRFEEIKFRKAVKVAEE